MRTLALTFIPYTTLFRSPTRRNCGRTPGGGGRREGECRAWQRGKDRKSTRLNSSHVAISYAVFCLKKKKLMSPKPNMIYQSFLLVLATLRRLRLLMVHDT